MSKNENDIELRSEDFQEVLSTIPSWILRWGITMIGIVIIVLIAGSALFKYPDVITAKITLTKSIPTAGVVAKSTGKIQKIYVKDKQKVHRGDYLAVIENPTDLSSVTYLKSYLKTLSNMMDSIPSIPKNDINLGELQSLYTSFCMTVADYIQFKRVNYYPQKIDFVKDRIQRYQKYYANMKRQDKLVTIQTNINQKQYSRDSILHQKALISDEEMEKTYTSFIDGKLSQENMQVTLDNIQTQIAEMKENLLDIEYQEIDKSKTLENQLKTQASQLLNAIQTWEMNYVLISPLDGNITFTKYWANNQNIISGDEIFNIVPAQKGNLIGKALLPINRSGKVKLGQRVNIRFDNFPDSEFGVIRGIVNNISLVPTKEGETNQYILEIELPNGLYSTYNKELPYLPEMEGEADIVTDDLSLLERFFLPLKKLIKNS